MIVIRPKKVHHTPFMIASDLRCQTRRYPNKQDIRADYARDFLMFPVPPAELRNVTEDYRETFAFAVKNKLGQRQALNAAGILVPRASGSRTEALEGDKYVVRPLRHSRGRGYRVTDDRLDFTPGSEYISELYPKRREYRVIFLFGKPLIWLRKKPHDDVQQDAPWGHVNSTFQTINDVSACKLSATDCVARLSDLPVVKGAHIVAADVLWAGKQYPEKPYAVLELNFCPALDIENNRAKVVEGIRARV